MRTEEELGDAFVDEVDDVLSGRAGGGDHLRGLAKAGIDNFHAGVAEGAGNDLGAAVVAVEAGLGDQHANFLFWHFSVPSEVFLCELRVRQPCKPLKNIPPNAIFQGQNIKIDQQTQMVTREAKVGKQDGLMDWVDGLDGF